MPQPNGQPTVEEARQMIAARVSLLPNDLHLLISVFNTIGIIATNREYFDEVNGKFFKGQIDKIKK